MFGLRRNFSSQRPPLKAGDFFKKEESFTDTAARTRWLAALRQKIVTEKRKNLSAAFSMAAGELIGFLVNGLEIPPENIHPESVLAVLGSLAGFGCQMSLRKQFLKEGLIPEETVFVVVRTNDGGKYYFGDALNKRLIEGGPDTAIAPVLAAALKLGYIGDLKKIFEHVAATVGHPGFGVPRMPDNHQVGDLPLNYVRAIWPKVLPLVTQMCDGPAEWPRLLGLACQRFLLEHTKEVPPRIAVSIVLECSIAMSKVDLPEFYGPPPT